jgi:hypothetical protein
MNAAEVVVSKMQSDGGFQMRQFLGIAKSEARKSFHLLAHRQVAALDKAGRNMLRIGIANSDFGYNPLERTWGVPPLRSVMLSVIPKHFRKLREVHIRAKELRNFVRVVIESVRSKLHAVRKALVQVPQKLSGIRSNTFPNTESGNQLGFCIKSNVDPLVTDLRGVTFVDAAAFLLNKRPDFINLQIPGVQVSHSCVHQLGTVLSGDQKQAHDRVAVQTSEPLCAADRAAFQKTGQRPCSSIRAGAHGAQGRSGLRFAEGNVAGLAAPTLNAALTEVPKPLAGVVLAFEAGHVISPLAFCEETSQNRFSRSMAWVTPRFGLVPASAETEAGTLNVRGYLARWINGYYHRWTVGSEANCDRDLHCVPPFSCRSVSQALSGSYLGQKLFLPAVCFPVLHHLALRFLGSSRLHKFGVEDVNRIATTVDGLLDSVTRSHEPSQCCVQESKRTGVSAYVNSHTCKMLHNNTSSESTIRLGHQDLSAQFRKASRRSRSIFHSKGFKSPNRLLQLSNSLCNGLQRRLLLLQLLFGSEIAGFVRVYVNVRHFEV